MQLKLIPVGLCQCGCGQPTTISKQTDPRKGSVKGQPNRFLHGHGKLAAPPETAPATKTCSRCGKSKPLPAFRANKRGAHGKDSLCKACNNAMARAWRLQQEPDKLRDLNLSKIGGSVAYYDAQFEKQGGVCAICGGSKTHHNNMRRGGQRMMCLDHDHETGQLRGILCSACNMALGGFKDSPELLASALEYLASWRTQ